MASGDADPCHVTRARETARAKRKRKKRERKLVESWVSQRALVNLVVAQVGGWMGQKVGLEIKDIFLGIELTVLGKERLVKF